MLRHFMALALAGLVVASASPATAQVQWQRISDPSPDHAFSVEAPRGWRTEVGTWRRSAVEFGHAVTTTSPDGTIALFMGDPNSRMYSTPNAATNFAGLPEGREYNPAPTLFTIIRPYMTGAQVAVATDLGRQRIALHCQNPQSTQVRDLPRQSGTLDFVFGQGGVAFSVAAGEASFSCRMDGRLGAGYIFAATQKSITGILPPNMGENAMWRVDPVAGFACTEARAGEASELLIHLVGSIEMDPNWVAAQHLTTMAVSNIVTNTTAAIFKSISESFWYRRALLDRTFAQGSEARRGVRVYHDPVLGENHELDNRGYKWIDPSGRILTTTTDTPPAPGFRALQPVR